VSFSSKYKERYPRVFRFLELAGAAGSSVRLCEDNSWAIRRPFAFDPRVASAGRKGQAGDRAGRWAPRRGNGASSKLRRAANATDQLIGRHHQAWRWAASIQELRASRLPARLLLQWCTTNCAGAAPETPRHRFLAHGETGDGERRFALRVPLVWNTRLGSELDGDKVIEEVIEAQFQSGPCQVRICALFVPLSTTWS